MGMNPHISMPIAEGLESRLLYAVDYITYFQGPFLTLRIYGDAMAGGFITFDAPDALNISGAPAPAGSLHTFDYTFSSPTLVNGVRPTIQADDVEIVMGGGDDVVTMTNVEDAYVALGFGNDRVNLAGVCRSVGIVPLTPAERAANPTASDGRDVVVANNSQGVNCDGGDDNDEMRVQMLDASQFYGNDGNDILTLSGDFTNSTFRGGKGDDLVTVAAGVHPGLTGSYFYGDQDNDTINLQGSKGMFITINGGIGNDILKGGDGQETIFANDNVIGNDQVDGGPGADFIHYDSPGEFMIWVDWNDIYIEHDVII